MFLSLCELPLMPAWAGPVVLAEELRGVPVHLHGLVMDGCRLLVGSDLPVLVF